MLTFKFFLFFFIFMETNTSRAYEFLTNDVNIVICMYFNQKNRKKKIMTIKKNVENWTVPKLS